MRRRWSGRRCYAGRLRRRFEAPARSTDGAWRQRAVEGVRGSAGVNGRGSEEASVNANEENLGRYLVDRYVAYLAELPDKEWMSIYQRLCERTKQIASKLNGEGREQLVQACSQVPEAGGLDNYMRELWYERDNGVASLRQGGVSLQIFEQM